MRAILLASLLVCSLAAAAENLQVIKPAITKQALINPGMGWVHFHYSNRLWAYGGQQPSGDTLDWFPGCSTIYFRIPWCYLEPEEGKFRWDLIDSYAQPWMDSGKKIAFRVIASEDRFVYATPKWVKDAGAKGIYYRSGQKYNTDAELWDPIFDDPVFLEKLDHFLAAMAKRYNGNPNVAFVDIGSFGLWGEGHTGYSSKLNQEQTDKAVKIHIDLHKKHFPDSLLAISDDVAGASRPGTNFPITDYAFSRDVTLRDDSIMVNKAPKQWYHAGMAQQFWPTLPVILEHGHYDWLV
ncbi:MAG: beta-galactosidase, partial [Verrucomicrobiia bacterium]